MPRVLRASVTPTVPHVAIASAPAAKPTRRGPALDGFAHTRAEADSPNRMGLPPSLDEMFARSTPLGGFRSTLGQGQLAAERVDDTVRLYLKTTDGFSFSSNAAFREEVARRVTSVAGGMSEAMFDDPRTSVRFIVGPKDFAAGVAPKTYEVRPSNATFAFTSIPVDDLRALSQGQGLSLYAEVTVPNWNGGHQHAFINLDGHSFSNFQLPPGLVD